MNAPFKLLKMLGIAITIPTMLISGPLAGFDRDLAHQ